MVGMRNLPNFPKLHITQVVGLFNDLDINGDGRVTLDEFTETIGNFVTAYPRGEDRANQQPAKPQPTSPEYRRTEVSRSPPPVVSRLRLKISREKSTTSLTSASDAESTDSVTSEYAGVRRAQSMSGMGMDSSYQGVGSSYNNFSQGDGQINHTSRRKAHALALRKREDEARKKADVRLRAMKYEKERGRVNEPDTAELLERSRQRSALAIG